MTEPNRLIPAREYAREFLEEMRRDDKSRRPLGIVTGPGISCQIAPDGTRTTTLGDLVRVDKL